MTMNPAQLRLTTLGVSASDENTRPARLTPAAAAVESRVNHPIIADRQGLMEAFRRHAPAVHRFLMVRTRNDAALCDDLMQQTFLAAAKGAMDVPVAEIGHWLRAVARRALITHIRREGVRHERLAHRDAGLSAALADELAGSQGDAVNNGAAGTIISTERGEQLLLALTELESDVQDLLILHYFRGHSQQRIAADMSTTPRAIEGRLYRARTALRERLLAADADWLND